MAKQKVGLSRKAIYTVKGFTGTLDEIASYFSINVNTLCTRLYTGMSLLEAVTLPVNKKMSICASTIHQIGNFKGDSDACNNWFGVRIPSYNRAHTDKVQKLISDYVKPEFYQIGKKYKGTLRAISEDYGIPESKLRTSLKEGIMPAEVLKQAGISVD